MLHEKTIATCELKPDATFAGIIVAGMDLGAATLEVHVTYEDGTAEQLFSYYVDELSFTTQEFVGLTRKQAFDLRLKRDTAYLRS